MQKDTCSSLFFEGHGENIEAAKIIRKCNDAQRSSYQPGKWPPQAPDKPLHMESEIFKPFPFIGDFASGKVGPIFEWRSYMIAPGMMPSQMERWEAAIDARTELSPLVSGKIFKNVFARTLMDYG